MRKRHGREGYICVGSCIKVRNSAQALVQEMTELFDFLLVAGETVSEEDRSISSGKTSRKL